MKKFFALFSIPASVVDEWKKSTPPEKMKAASEEMMGAWKKWMTDHEKSLVDKGKPLGKTKRITANGVSDVRNDLNWYLSLGSGIARGGGENVRGPPAPADS